MDISLLIGAVVFVMVAGLIATLAVGWSKANRSENTGYGSGTGKKWTRLGLIYAACVAVAMGIFLAIFYN